MTRLSNRQFPMLRQFAHADHDFTMTIEQAQRFDQRPFRSMLVQGWIAFRPGKNGFYLTQKGAAAWEEFRGTKILRKDPMAPLTSYFDMSSYGLRIKARGAA
jgi:hypothetical protein